ncbi:vitamin K epoxide reductase family protein [Streptomyces xinghaiensis]|uniref:vitamin K epoxide reductase family protein n=1 Tax=Streptomyces xinghaiensis TaxID=1038928 RepID=UPI00378AB8DF
MTARPSPTADSAPDSATGRPAPMPAPEGDGIGAGRLTAVVITVAGVLGWLASFGLARDSWALLEDPDYAPACDISPVIGCGDIARTWQAEAFGGVPNMLWGLGVFAVVGALGLALLAGARFRRWLWLLLLGGSLLGVVFAHWLIYQSLYVLGELCPYCMLIWVVTIALFWTLLTDGLRNGVLPVPEHRRKAADAVLDVRWLLLLGWYAVIAVFILTRFWSYWTSLV